MTLRRTLFTLYGMGIGLAYVAVLQIAWQLSVILAVILGVVVVALFSYYSNRLPTAAEMSDWQLLVAIPLLPFAMLGGIVAFGIIILAMAVFWPYAVARATVVDRRFRDTMKSKGRFARLDELRPRLIAGEGTLIEDTGQKGPLRLWWTQDDLFALGSPVSTDEEFQAVLLGEGHLFNSRCLNEYLDANNGKALLTSIPVRYATSGKLARLYPSARVAKVFRPFGNLR